MASPSTGDRASCRRRFDSGPEFGRLKPICMACVPPDGTPVGTLLRRVLNSRDRAHYSRASRSRGNAGCRTQFRHPGPASLPSALASPQERARAVQAVLDKHGPEMDRRRELTPGGGRRAGGPGPAAHAAARRAGRAGGSSRRLLQGQRGASPGPTPASGWFVNQSNVSIGDLGGRHAARGGRRGVRRSRAPAWPGARGTTRARRSASRAAIG